VPPAPSAGFRVRWNSLTWLGAALVALGALVLFLVHDTGSQQPGGETISRAESRRTGWRARGRIGQRGVRLPGRSGRAAKAGGSEESGSTPSRQSGPRRRTCIRPSISTFEISETRGNVKGQYAAKYSVWGRPIPPFCVFRIWGSARPPSADLKWSGSGGTAGHVRLTLLSARLLRVDWSTDQPGEKKGTEADFRDGHIAAAGIGTEAGIRVE